MEVMKPMSARARRKLAFVSATLFVLLVPCIVLYASGYRFSFSGSKVTSTGGIFVSLSPSGSAFSVDGEYVQSTGIFSNSFFEQDLNPGVHELSVSKDGYETWTKKISVKPNEVSEVNSLLLPTSVAWKRVIIGTTTSTSTIGVSSDQYASMRELFVGTSTSRYVLPISTTTARVSGGISMWIEGNVLIAERRASNLQLPGVFCVDGINSCVSRIFIPLSAVPSFVDFYPDRSDAVIVAFGPSVFVIEMDNHSPRLVRMVYSGTQPKARVSKGLVYIRDVEGFFVTDQFSR